MKKFLKWAGIFVAGLLGLAIVAFLGYFIYWTSQARQTIDVEVETFAIPTDEASIARGKVLVDVVRCTECHGKDLGGMLWTDSLMTGTFGPANLTPGENGLTNYSDEDYIRAIRHGLGQNDKPLIYMPSNFYRDLNQRDLGSIIAYLKSLDPSEEAGPPNTTGPYLWQYTLSKEQGLPAVKMIDHTETAVAVGPDPEDTVAFGEYLALPCKSCHGDDFAGVPHLERLRVSSPNITPYNLGEWTEEEFMTAMKEGALPDGRYIPQTLMPWEAIGQLPDEELHAIWVYLQSLPAIADQDALAYQQIADN